MVEGPGREGGGGEGETKRRGGAGEGREKGNRKKCGLGRRG